MITITGDAHGNFRRFETRYFPQQRQMSRSDYVIVCGDFGIWDETEESNRWLDWLNAKPFTTLFLDGNHDNHDLLRQMPQREWHGGMVHEVREHILHLMRGQVYEIGGIRVFTMGGAVSHDVRDGILEPDDPDFDMIRRVLDQYHGQYRVNHESWWKEELPDPDEYEQARAALERAGWNVDCVLTHCAPTSIQRQINRSYERNQLTDFLDEVWQRCRFGLWFCGHYHMNRQMDKRFMVLWEQLVGINIT